MPLKNYFALPNANLYPADWYATPIPSYGNFAFSTRRLSTGARGIGRRRFAKFHTPSIDQLKGAAALQSMYRSRGCGCRGAKMRFGWR